MIKVGDTLPVATLMEFSEVEGEGCSIGPNPVDTAKATAGKTIALFAFPVATREPREQSAFIILSRTLPRAAWVLVESTRREGSLCPVVR